MKFKNIFKKRHAVNNFVDLANRRSRRKATFIRLYFLANECTTINKLNYFNQEKKI
jgi:hypothetical protein